MKMDLTRGKPAKLILLFMLPILIGNVFQQLYNTVDTVIVGRTLGADALAGVGATGAVSFLIIGFVSGLTGGFAVMTSQCFGAKNEDAVKRSVATSLTLCAILCVVMTAVSVLAVGPLLRLMRTPSEIYGYSYAYIVTVCWGLAATVLYNMVSSIVRALGDSTTPLVFLVVASAINVGLDFLFIVGLKTGVAGAGIATVVSQGLAGLGCAVFMFLRFPVLRLRGKDFRMGGRWIWRHLVIGLPMAFQFSITAVGIMVQQSALNTLGKTAVTAYSAANKIDNLATQILVSLGAAMATYCGQNYGAGRYDRIRSGVLWGSLIGAVGAGIAALFVVFFGSAMTRLFLSDAGGEMLALSRRYLVYQGVFYVFLAAIYVYRNSLQGMGKSVVTVVAGVIELAMRIVASFALVSAFRFTGICLSNPVAWIGAAVFLVITYFVVIRKYKSRPVPRAEEEENR